MNGDFVVIPELFYKAQQAIINSEEILKSKRSYINNCKLKFPNNYEFKNEVINICDNISKIITDVSRLERKVSESKDRLISLDNAFAVMYYQCAASKYNDFVGPLSNDQHIDSQYTIEKYNESLYKYLGDLNAKGLLNDEQKEIFNNLDMSFKLSEKQAELEKLKKKPVSMPAVGAGRLTEKQAKELMKKSQEYNQYITKVNSLEKEIKNIQKNLGIYQNKWYEDFGEAFSKTGSAWKTAWETKNVDDVINATKQTVATGAVVYRSAQSGIAKIVELVVDGVAIGAGGIKAGVTWLGDHDAGKNVMDETLDFVRRDLVGEANKDYYENNPIGKWINENSNLKYDSAGAQAIQNASEFVGKLALATGATVLSGGTAAPIILGALYGAGNAGEKYTQSIDRESGDSYNYSEALLRSSAGAVAGAAEFYGYGQMGAGVLGVNISPQASTSFVKNFLVKDTILDSVSVVTDHGVNVAFGDETWQHALLYGGAEFVFALGMSAMGARQATKSARTTALAKETYSHASDEITDNIIEINESNYSRNASRFTSKKDYYEVQAYVAKNNYWYEDSNGRWQHKVLDKNDPGLTACYTKKFKKEWKKTIDNSTVNGMTKTNNYNTNVNGFIDYVLGQPGKSYGTFGYKGNYNFAVPGSVEESLKNVRKIDGENFINTMSINRGTDVSNAKRIIFTEVDVPRTSVSMHSGKELGSNIQRLPGALPDNSLELVYESIDITDTVADSTKVIIKNENGKTLFKGSLSKLKELQNDKKNRQFFNMIMGIIEE